jgi:putrescine transport system permease protein
MRRSSSRVGTSALILGYAFLYIPLIFLVLYSFNASRFPGLWTHFSLCWYEDLWKNDAILTGFINSLKIAVCSATLSTFLGGCAAIALNRQGRSLKNRHTMTLLLSVPLVMPEIITGLSLLILFLSFEALIGWPSERGFVTVMIGHVTLAIAYVYLIVRARMRDIDPVFEEAALDLGAKPLKVLLLIDLPLISPALVSGWLLAFALSLDDVVLASFLSGPGTTTLPMVIFSSLRLGVSPEIHALSTLIIGIVSLCFVVIDRKSV